MLPSVKSLCYSLQLRNLILGAGWRPVSTSSSMLKKNYLQDLEDYSDITIPDKPKLPVLLKVPKFDAGQKPMKMEKNLHFMRGPEEVHNTLLHEQFGIIALTGGRLMHGHIEMMRNTLGRKIDTSRMFAIWRIDGPWQPVTKRGVGKRHGGGKGNISHYVTPLKQGRVILEVGGKCGFEEVRPVLEQIAAQLPFKAMAVDVKTMLAMKKLEEFKEQRNINPYTFKYLVMNRMCGSQNWLKPIDKLYFGKYV